MENIDEMRERHEKEIEELQNQCKHKNKSGWIDCYWAPGHGGGQIKYCKDCGKVVKRKQEKWMKEIITTSNSDTVNSSFGYKI